MPAVTMPALPAVNLGGVLGPGSLTCQFLNQQLQLAQQSQFNLLANAYTQVLGFLGCAAPAP
jgi:hypothetical protein